MRPPAIAAEPELLVYQAGGEEFSFGIDELLKSSTPKLGKQGGHLFKNSSCTFLSLPLKAAAF